MSTPTPQPSTTPPSSSNSGTGLTHEVSTAAAHRAEPSTSVPEPHSSALHNATRGQVSAEGPQHHPHLDSGSTEPFLLARAAASSSAQQVRSQRADAPGGITRHVSSAIEGAELHLDDEYRYLNHHAHQHELQKAIADYSTTAIHGGREPDPTTGAILTPIVQSTTYVQRRVGEHQGHTYSRASNPTVSVLEKALGALESALPATAFSTGMAAISALFFATLRAGDHVIVGDVVYGGTVRFLDVILAPLGVTTSYVDATNPEKIKAAIKENTRLLFIETPANPTLKLADISALAVIAKSKGVLLAVDNTFMTPVLLRPLDLGADVSVYSTTKYIEGHNATVGGALTSRSASLNERFALIRKTLGSIQSPFEAWLTLRGIKTLPLRIKQHSRNAQVVAEFLVAHPAIERVSYPGLRNFPQHELAQRMHGPNGGYHGGIISFEVKGGAKVGVSVMNSVRLCSLAENLGAVETLITHPATMTHGAVPKEQRLATGITDGLIRLSVGLEDPTDIIADLDNALRRAAFLHETGGDSAHDQANHDVSGHLAPVILTKGTQPSDSSLGVSPLRVHASVQGEVRS